MLDMKLLTRPRKWPDGLSRRQSDRGPAPYPRVERRADVYGHLTALHLVRHLNGGNPEEAKTEEKSENEIETMGIEALYLANKFCRHMNPEVAKLATIFLKICPNLSRRQKKDLRKFVSP